MLSADLMMDIIGILEYDPVLPDPAGHREFLTNGCQFRQVLLPGINKIDLFLPLSKQIILQFGLSLV